MKTTSNIKRKNQDIEISPELLIFLMELHKRLYGDDKNRGTIPKFINRRIWRVLSSRLEKIKKFRNKKILVLYNMEIVFYLISEGIDPKNICFFSSKEEVSNVMKNYVVSGHSLTNSLSFGIFSSQFDIIIGNPPYQYPKGNAPISKGKSLYLDFIEGSSKILKDGGSLVFIGPANYLKPTDYRKETKSFNQLRGLSIIEIETGIEEKFNTKIGTFISLLHCKKSENSERKFIVDEEEWDLEKIPFIFSRGSKELRSLGKKIWEKITNLEVGNRMNFHRAAPEKLANYGISVPMCARAYQGRDNGIIEWSSDRSSIGGMSQILNLDLDVIQINRLFRCKAFAIITSLTYSEPTIYHNLLNGIVLPKKLKISEETTDREIMESYGFDEPLIKLIEEITVIK